MTEPKKKKPKEYGIPANFDSKWPGSDVVLKIQDMGETKSVYASRAILAFYSPTYFNPMFFHEFEEKTKEEVSIDVHYDRFINILRILHHIDYERNLRWLAPYKGVYKIAHEFDFPFIRQRILQETETMTSAQTYFFKQMLGIEMNRAAELSKMDGDNIREYLEFVDGNPTFTLEEAIAMVRACNQPVHRNHLQQEGTARICYNCGDLVPKKNEDDRCQPCVETSSADFSQKWDENALPAKTTEVCGGELEIYLVPGIMAVFSNNFHEKMEKKLKKGKLKLSHSFGVMNWILRTLLHKVRLDNYLEHFFPDDSSFPMLSEISEAADEMEIPFLQQICKVKLNHPYSGQRFIIRPLETDIAKKKLRFSYNVIKDIYKWGDVEIQEWKSGVYFERNMYRKQEWDHRKAYLCRQDDEDEEYDVDSEIQWCVDLTGVKAKRLSIKGLACTTFHYGKYERCVKSDDKIWKFPEEKDEIVLENPVSMVYWLVVKLMGGKGNVVSWQYSQLFRALMKHQNQEQLIIEADLV